VARSRRRDLVVVVVALAVAGLAAVGVLVLRSTGSAAGSSVSRGEVIFQSGTDANGDLIPRISSGTSKMGAGTMGAGMMGAGCVTCHGSDGHGRTTPTFTSPDITYGNLTDPRGMLMPDGTRGPAYTDAGIMKAVTQGLDPAGSRLEAPMPQWQLSISAWGDLLAYLKTLH
jgi:mono/diheme cytochrome c family protein